jgi:hypothetical protein
LTLRPSLFREALEGSHPQSFEKYGAHAGKLVQLKSTHLHWLYATVSTADKWNCISVLTETPHWPDLLKLSNPRCRGFSRSNETRSAGQETSRFYGNRVRKKPVTGLYSGPAENSLHPHIPRSVLISSSHLYLGFPVPFSLQIFRLKFCINFCSMRATCSTTHPPWVHHPNNIKWRLGIKKLLNYVIISILLSLQLT